MRAATSNRRAALPSFVTPRLLSSSDRSRRRPAMGAVGVAVVLGAIVATSSPALADDRRPLVAAVLAAPRPQPPQPPLSATPLVAPVGSAPAPTSSTVPSTIAAPVVKNDPLCRNKLKLVAQLEREKARALTLLSRAVDRLERARGSARPAVVAAFQKEVDSNQDRVDELQGQLDQLRLRCP